jgi:hypothetical protein
MPVAEAGLVAGHNCSSFAEGVELAGLLGIIELAVVVLGREFTPDLGRGPCP